MDVKPSVKFFNAAIGIVWAVIGVLLFTGSLANPAIAQLLHMKAEVTP